jgi:predicted dehydrogenase
MATSKLRIGVLGLTHDHVWENLTNLQESDLGQLVAAADPNSPLRDKVRSLGCDRVFPDYLSLLDGVELDAVYIYSNNRESAELAVEAARRGLHVMLEKPMAADLAGAARVHAAVKSAGVQLLVNWPFYWWPRLQRAFELIEQGMIGQVFQVNYRAAHAGPREQGCSPYFSDWLYDPVLNGAGALMDYGSYGAALSCHLLGLPSRVGAFSGRMVKEDLLADDNAVMVMQHPGALSTATASWTTVGHMTSYIPEIYGSEGTLAVRPDGLWLATSDDEEGAQLDVPPPPPHARSSTAYFLHHIASSIPIGGFCSAEAGLAAQHVLEAALISVREERVVSLPLPTILLS